MHSAYSAAHAAAAASSAASAAAASPSPSPATDSDQQVDGESAASACDSADDVTFQSSNDGSTSVSCSEWEWTPPRQNDTLKVKDSNKINIRKGEFRNVSAHMLTRRNAEQGRQLSDSASALLPCRRMDTRGGCRTEKSGSSTCDSWSAAHKECACVLC